MTRFFFPGLETQAVCDLLKWEMHVGLSMRTSLLSKIILAHCSFL